MKKAAIWVAAAGVAVILTGCGKSCKVANVPATVATVNGQGIPASQYLDMTSRRAGRDVLSSLIEQNIILKWAKDENVPPTQDQINKQIEILKRDGVYDRQVKLLGEDAIKSELTAMQARINLAKKVSKVSDSELKSAYEMMKQRYIHGPRKYVALIINPDKKKIEDAAKAVKGGMSFDDAAAEYSDKRFSMGGGPIEIWIAEGQQGMPKELTDAAKNTKVGEVSEVFSFGQTGMPTNYAVMKVTQEQPKANLTLKDVKDEVEDAAALQKSQMDPKFTQALNDKKKAAKITIDIPYLKDVAGTINNPPETPMAMPTPQRVAPKAKK
ncbi:MAG: peptidyl-prolyl cis-trans isomerase [Armatimonadota bacterium]